MGNDKIIYEGITFDDILLLPAKSNVLPRETNIETRLTKNIKLNIPSGQDPAIYNGTIELTFS